MSNDFEADLTRVMNDVKIMLLDKNRKYGNSALEPVRIFSKCDDLEQISVRMDDKLSRIRSGSQDDEDPYMDLIGYLLLREVKKIQLKRKEEHASF